MTKDNIVQLGSELLRQQAEPITDFASPQFKQLLTDMQQLMEEANGVGIAAPQIGVSRQALIIASRPTSRYPHAPLMAATVICNPRFEVIDATRIKDWEGCLSVPGIRALVPRYRAITVSYQDANGSPCQLTLEDFPARVFQHEFDHLQGLVYLDRVENNADIIAESEYFKRLAG